MTADSPGTFERPSTALADGNRIERELGGGKARVFLAIDTALRREIVMKVRGHAPSRAKIPCYAGSTSSSPHLER